MKTDKKLRRFGLGVSMAAFIVNVQAGKKANYYNLPIHLVNYCRKASILN
jgi:hypothetical protein